MIKNGGYQIIDLQDRALTNGGSFTIKGLYNQLKNSARKPIMVTGVKYGTTLYNAVVGTTAYASGTTQVVEFKLVDATVAITVANTDEVDIVIE